MSTSENPLPDVAVGHHPDFGIVATNPKDRAASAWMLRNLDFHPVPGHPSLYALAKQERDGQERALRAVARLREATYHVDADIAFDPSLVDSREQPAHRMPEPVAPDVAFAVDPQLGMIAAATDGVPLAQQLLAEHGWRPHPQLDIHTLPPATDRNEGLNTVARATVAMNRAGLRVAAQPALALDAIARRIPAPAVALPETEATHSLPGVDHAALSASPAALPSTPPVSSPVTTVPAGAVDPRVAYSRTH
ncbi:hypothetical protein ACIO1C_22460 [Streptomyces sp. NPDC087420]|uniref:hypothetical protein n=1 Tax=Streptomyces sp. NPDC087420 TaxID=3365785 RepID=UPI003836AF78